MKCFISYQRLQADTINGETLVVYMRYTTFDPNEMNKFEENIRNTIGYGVMTEIKVESEDEE